MLAATQSRPRPSGASSSGDESHAPIHAAKRPRMPHRTLCPVQEEEEEEDGDDLFSSDFPLSARPKDPWEDGFDFGEQGPSLSPWG